MKKKTKTNDDFESKQTRRLKKQREEQKTDPLRKNKKFYTQKEYHEEQYD